jgi:hypothetical protein
MQVNAKLDEKDKALQNVSHLHISLIPKAAADCLDVTSLFLFMGVRKRYPCHRQRTSAFSLPAQNPEWPRKVGTSFQRLKIDQALRCLGFCFTEPYVHALSEIQILCLVTDGACANVNSGLEDEKSITSPVPN